MAAFKTDIESKHNTTNTQDPETPFVGSKGILRISRVASGVSFEVVAEDTGLPATKDATKQKITHRLLQGILSMPIEVSSPSSSEDFYDPEGPSLREVFAKRKQMIAQRRIEFHPNEMFAESDEKLRRSVLQCPPVPFTFAR